mmetsp:Transcript_61681/g.180250  ORF Transcript_61681/g.180250 Transcript_61681/m.180250 type:complete len:221 (+) Transcript_61681:1035-1697(+)
MWSNRWNILVGPLLERVYPLPQVIVLDQVELFPAVLSKHKLKEEAAVVVSHHVLRCAAVPCANNLVAVLHTIRLDASTMPLPLRMGLDDGHLLIGVVPVVELAHLVKVALLGNVVVGHLVLDVPPDLLDGLYPLLRRLRHGAKVLTELAVLFVVHGQLQLRGHGPRLEAAAVVEAPAELVDLHEVVDVLLVLCDGDSEDLATAGPVVKLHPRLHVERVNS